MSLQPKNLGTYSMNKSFTKNTQKTTQLQGFDQKQNTGNQKETHILMKTFFQK